MARATRIVTPQRGQIAAELIGPLGTDLRGFGVFSEIGPAENVTVPSPRIVLFDANGEPLTRKVGF